MKDRLLERVRRILQGLRGKGEVFFVFTASRFALQGLRKVLKSELNLSDGVRNLEDKTQKNKIKFTVRVDKKL
ncbi:hypothetical protein A0128_21515 [Leptospira tipperaryensis]|uniref:Uncharacterized protein n=1 Tax=Leptospira tipperaryensis TaxID=2564040 RepID=A0A1D7V437_9LEPT|nr:hypothetical protein A0128_21515 [Leptospira tipperaryensis]